MEEVKEKISVAEMVETTGKNTATFMAQVAEHISKLEAEVINLRQRISELESAE
jgi:uncharacterized protein YceH (UPF0502 family)